MNIKELFLIQTNEDDLEVKLYLYFSEFVPRGIVVFF